MLPDFPKVKEVLVAHATAYIEQRIRQEPLLRGIRRTEPGTVPNYPVPDLVGCLATELDKVGMPLTQVAPTDCGLALRRVACTIRS
jgi:hypothetical protein